MKLTFIGVGAALDGDHVNISMILEMAGKKILLDCGPQVPFALWRHSQDQELLDAVWISHLHADHTYGLASLLLKMKNAKRKKKLVIITNPETEEQVRTLLKIGYPNMMETLGFEAEFMIANKGEYEDIKFGTAPTTHPVPNKAIRFEADGEVFCYSGDGMFTEETKELYKGADLLVQETFTIDEEEEGHANIEVLADIMDELAIKKAACVHVTGHIRKHKQKILDYIKNTGKNLLFPEEGDVIQ